MSGEVRNSPLPKRARAEEAEVAECEGGEGGFVHLPEELQIKILAFVSAEQGISLREKVKRLGTIRLLCRYTSGRARMPQARVTFKREQQRRNEFLQMLDLPDFQSRVKGVIAKDVTVGIVFSHMIEDTDGTSAFKGLRAWAKVNDVEEALLNKCSRHMAEGNRSLANLAFT